MGDIDFIADETKQAFAGGWRLDWFGMIHLPKSDQEAAGRKVQKYFCLGCWIHEGLSLASNLLISGRTENYHYGGGSVKLGEGAQLSQTIEMFEVITQSQPQDYQSLEILKEAYSKLGREKDAINTSKRIALAYVQLGQLSLADVLEYEAILPKISQ